jgi:hypothetical protein
LCGLRLGRPGCHDEVERRRAQPSGPPKTTSPFGLPSLPRLVGAMARCLAEALSRFDKLKAQRPAEGLVERGEGGQAFSDGLAWLAKRRSCCQVTNKTGSWLVRVAFYGRRRFVRHSFGEGYGWQATCTR